jgi:iron complex outermembrane receptor protein
MPIRLHHLLGSVSSLAVLIAAPAFAQQAPPTSDPAVAEVVVTGSLIRGIAPVGTNVVSVGQAQFLQTGATSVNSLLTNTPALTNMFNIVPNVPGTASGRSSWRPNIRNLPESSGQPTLVLMDGHNMVGVSVQQVSPDMNVLPPGALERIEVDADGGSAMYGSNAVGGVINLIPRKHFQGIEMQGNVGVANGYKTGSLSVTGGNSWNNGGFVVSLYSRAQTEFRAATRATSSSEPQPTPCPGGSRARLTSVTSRPTA